MSPLQAHHQLLLPLLLLPLLLLPITSTTTTSPLLPCTAATPTTTPSTTTASNGVSRLGVSLLQQLTAPTTTATATTVRTTNTLISPYSVWMVLALAYIGAEMNTEAQLAQAIGLTAKEGVIGLLKDYQEEITNRTLTDSRISLESVNRLYVDQSLSFQRCNKELADHVVTLDLMKQPQQSATTINAFVSSTTKGLIPSILTPGILTEDTRMVVVNAVYFKGAWVTPFDANKTRVRPFSLLEEGTVPVEMMEVENALVKIGHSQELQAQILQLPYSSGVLNMTIILPLPKDNIKEAFQTTVNALSYSALKNAFNSLEEDYFDVLLPKFEIRSEFNEDMIKALQVLGVKDMFSSNLADFSSFRKDLFVKHFIHKTVVSVDEEGTEAAGATAAVFVTKIRKIVRVNKPFIFLIHDSDTIFFIGTFVRP